MVGLRFVIGYVCGELGYRMCLCRILEVLFIEDCFLEWGIEIILFLNKFF